MTEMSRRRLVFGLLGAAAAGGMTACQNGSASGHGGATAGRGSAGGDKPAWHRHEIWGTGQGEAMVAADGTVYATFFGDLRALDASSGTRRWVFRPEQSAGSEPVPAGDAVYFVGAANIGRPTKVYALDAHTGAQRWVFTGAPNQTAPMSAATAGDAVYVATSGVMYALDAATGKERWNWHRGQLPVQFGPPAIAGKTVYVGNAAGLVYAFDAASGRLRWSVKCGDDFGNAAFLTRPLVADGRVYVNARGARPGLYALRAADGKQLWHFQRDRGSTRGAFDQAPIIASSMLCHVSIIDGKVYGLDPARGHKRWEFATPWTGNASPLAVGKGLLLVGGDTGVLYGLDPASGAPRWRYTPSGGRVVAGPAVSGDLVCIAVGSADSIEGDIYGIRL
jgi:outer membrane protein assembly factor BamB